MPAPITRLKPLGGAALASLATAINPFANAPAGTAFVRFTLRVAGATYTTNGATPVAATTGIDLAVGSYEWAMPLQDLQAIKMIQNGGITTGYVEYFAMEASAA